MAPNRTGGRGGTSPTESGRSFPVIIAAFSVIFYLPYFVTAATNLLPSYQDESQWWLYTMFINQSFARGFFPLWTPDLACGMPFLAWSHVAALYPTNLVFAVFEFGRAFWVTQMLHQVLFSLGVYWLCRRIGASPWAALTAALTASAQYTVGPVATFLPNLRTGSWAPLWLLCFHGLMVERRLRWLFGFSAVSLLMFLGGQVELIGLGWELLGVSSLAAAVIVWRRHGPRPLLQPAALFAVAFILSYLLSQVQALPTLELTRASIRGQGLTYEYFKIWSSWINLGSWLPFVPTGVSVVAVAAGAALFRGRPVAAVLVVALLFCAALMHNLFGVMRLMYLVPVARDLLSHARISTYVMALVPALMALGLDAMTEPAAARRWLRTAGTIGALLAVPLFFLGWFHPEKIIIAEQSGAEMALRLVRVSALMVGLVLPAHLALALAPGPVASRPRLVRAALAAIPLLVLAVPVLASLPRHPLDPFGVSPGYVRFFEGHRGLHRTQVIYPWDRWERIRIPVQSGALAGTRSADAFITVSLDRYTRLLGAFMPNTFVEKDGFIADLEATRVMKDSTLTDPRNWPLLDLMGIKYLVTEETNLRSPEVYSLAFPDTELAQAPGVSLGREEGRNFFSFRGRVESRLQLSAGDRLSFTADPGVPRWVMATAQAGGRARLVAARNVTSRTGLAGRLSDRDSLEALAFAALPPGSEPVRIISPEVRNERKRFREVFDLNLVDPAFKVFLNPSALPPTFIPERVVELPPDEALKFVRDNAEPGRRAVVEDMLPPPARPLARGESAEVVDYRPERVNLNVSARGPRLVVLTDSVFPGWEMTVNGRPERIRKADYAFRGVPVERGRSEVEMVYRPTSFRVGLWVSLVSLAAMAVAAGGRRKAGG